MFSFLKGWWDGPYRKELFFLVVVLGLGFYFRVVYLRSDPPLGLSWSNAATQDASWYTARAVEMALGHPLEKYGAGYDRHLNRPLFTWYCFLIYKIFGVNYGSHTLISVLPGMLSIVFVVLLFLEFYPSAHRYKLALAVAAVLSCHYIFIFFHRVPLLYAMISFLQTLSLYFWLKGWKRRRLFYFLLGWGVLVAGVLWCKVLVGTMAVVFLWGHFYLFWREGRGKWLRDSKVLLAIGLGGVVLAGFLYWNGFFGYAYRMYVLKLPAAPLGWEGWLHKLYEYGYRSRFFVRTPVMVFFSFVYMVSLLFFPRRICFLEKVVLVWALVQHGVLWPLSYAPVRFFVIQVIPVVMLGIFFLGWMFYSLEGEEGIGGEVEGEISEGGRLWWGYFISLMRFCLGIFGISFIFYHLIKELHRWWMGVEVFTIVDVRLSNDFNLYQVFGKHFFLALGLSLMLVGVGMLGRRWSWGRWKKYAWLGVRGGVVGLFLGGLACNVHQFRLAFDPPRYTQWRASRDLPVMVGEDAFVAGAYAQALALETRLRRASIFTLPVADPYLPYVEVHFANLSKAVKENPLLILEVISRAQVMRFNPYFARPLREKGITHLALPRFQPPAKAIERYFARAGHYLLLLRDIYLRGWPVKLYRICWDVQHFQWICDVGEWMFRFPMGFQGGLEVFSLWMEREFLRGADFSLGEGISQLLYAKSLSSRLEVWVVSLNRAYLYQYLSSFCYLPSPLRGPLYLAFQDRIGGLVEVLQRVFLRLVLYLDEGMRRLGDSYLTPYERSLLLFDVAKALSGLGEKVQRISGRAPIRPRLKARQVLRVVLGLVEGEILRHRHCGVLDALRADVLWALGRRKEAIGALKMALLKNRDDFLFLRRMGRFYEFLARGRSGLQRRELLLKALRYYLLARRLYSYDYGTRHKIKQLYEELRELRRSVLGG
ncbi:MAG: hypothetical protein D6805_03210 [Planctomycetota bacterium]|nr:MAG: hypothetical protein D6805_03210 [Planctomycetota bacterium]